MKGSATTIKPHRAKKLPARSPLKTQLILGTQDDNNGSPVFPPHTEKGLEQQSPTKTSSTTMQDNHSTEEPNRERIDLESEPPSWWAMGSPRLIATDTPEHVQAVVVKHFGAGVDMNRFLEPTRKVFDSFTSTQRDDYKKKGLLMPKIPGSWKKWATMHSAQQIKFINAICALSLHHAQCIQTSVVAAAAAINHDVEEIIASQNRTMHDYARVMHIMSCSDNLAAVTKAFGRYTRLELDEARSRLSADLEVSISGWKQLTVIFNDPNVITSPHF